MAIQHKIRTRNRKLKEVTLKRDKAIKIHCTACMGDSEEHPNDCGITDCPLFPYRGKSLATLD